MRVEWRLGEIRSNQGGKLTRPTPTTLCPFPSSPRDDDDDDDGKPEEIDMRLIIILTVIIYWLLPVDIAPGPLDDIIVTVAGLIMAAAEKSEVKA